MKILNYIPAILCSIALCSCSDADKNIAIGLASAANKAEAAGGSHKIKVSASGDWVATTDEPWNSISPANGRGTTECRILIDSALTDSPRRGAEYGGKPAFMLVPGIDVPFHSTLLRKGVPEFRDKLDALLPKHIDYRGRLVGRYIPNLVAVPFEMTKEFAAKILEVVPSERIKAALDEPKVWESYA